MVPVAVGAPFDAIHRPAPSAVVALIVAVAAVLVTYYLDRHPSKGPAAGTTTTTTLRQRTTTTVRHSLVVLPTSTSGNEAFYRVPAPRYQVEVTGAHGPTWAVYNMGPRSTLEWQGTVAHGSTKSLTMIGDSRSPSARPRARSVARRRASRRLSVTVARDLGAGLRRSVDYGRGVISLSSQASTWASSRHAS